MRQEDCDKCHMDGQSIRHTDCGGQISCGATLHPLTDLGLGFKGREFRVSKRYGKKVIGYRGHCMKCRKETWFLL